MISEGKDYFQHPASSLLHGKPSGPSAGSNPELHDWLASRSITLQSFSGTRWHPITVFRPCHQVQSIEDFVKLQDRPAREVVMSTCTNHHARDDTNGAFDAGCVRCDDCCVPYSIISHMAAITVEEVAPGADPGLQQTDPYPLLLR